MIQIYIILNKTNNKRYIGQTVDFDARIKKHLRIAKSGKDQRHLYQAIRKYGKDSFTWKTHALASNEKEADDLEMYWIKHFKSHDRKHGYNMTLGGQTNRGSFTAEVKEKMRLAKLGKKSPHMTGNNHPLFGVTGEKHHRFGVKHTQEARRKISEAGRKRKHLKGSKAPAAKITEKDVLWMREQFNSASKHEKSDIIKCSARKYNIKYCTVENIVYNQSWKHVKMFPNKGRTKGEESWSSKLVEKDILNIRKEMKEANVKRQKRFELANQYNVHESTIDSIHYRKTWKHIK